MADDTGSTPPRPPRRRRSDFDPTYIGPKVARERRRPKATPGASPRTPPATPAPPAAPRPGVAPTTPTTPTTVAAQTPVAAAIPAGRPWLPATDGRPVNPSICPFLRAGDGDGMVAPIERPDAANRCVALSEPVPQSLRQQGLVCLTSGHTNCPRYLRGAAAIPVPVTPAVRSRVSVSPAIVASIIAVIGAFVLSIGFVASRGGMDLTAVATPSPVTSASAFAAATPSPSATPAPTRTRVPQSPTPSPAPSATASPTPSATPTTRPTQTPAPSPSKSPSPTRSPGPKPTSDRYALLVACPSVPDCWIYTVRSGDNLYSIANYFGVKLARVYAMNPGLKDTGLRAGLKLRLPPPTR